jgi:Transposase, Mutator family
VFASWLLGRGVTRTNALESLVIAGFVRGLSTRDVEAALVEALGPEARVSDSTVSQICEAIKDEFDALKGTDLCDVELEYLFLDGSHFKFHPGAKADPVLVAWGSPPPALQCGCTWPQGPPSRSTRGWSFSASASTSRSTPGAALPGTLASPRTGLAPAGCPELVARLRHGTLLRVMAPALLDALGSRQACRSH